MAAETDARCSPIGKMILREHPIGAVSFTQSGIVNEERRLDSLLKGIA
jgi:hypothetical protein